MVDDRGVRLFYEFSTTRLPKDDLVKQQSKTIVVPRTIGGTLLT